MKLKKYAVLIILFHPREQFTDINLSRSPDLSISLLTRLPIPVKPEKWLMWVFVRYYSCGAVADFHRFPVTEIYLVVNPI
jgi:hypothetical protein